MAQFSITRSVPEVESLSQCLSPNDEALFCFGDHCHKLAGGMEGFTRLRHTAGFPGELRCPCCCIDRISLSDPSHQGTGNVGVPLTVGVPSGHDRRTHYSLMKSTALIWNRRADVEATRYFFLFSTALHSYRALPTSNVDRPLHEGKHSRPWFEPKIIGPRKHSIFGRT